jgi:hypothetical protein
MLLFDHDKDIRVTFLFLAAVELDAFQVGDDTASIRKFRNLCNQARGYCGGVLGEC